MVERSEKDLPATKQVFPKDSSQTKEKAISTSNTQKPLNEDKSINYGEWSTEEQGLFLEGLERYHGRQFGNSWEEIASHVKTRTRVQVCSYGSHYLKKTNCYWTTKEHQRFLEGLKIYGRGRWKVIASYVETKNKEQVSFHANEYFGKERMNKESQKMVERNEKDSPAARMLVKKPIHNLINVNSKNAKRSRDQAGDSTSTSSRKIKAKYSIKQKNTEQIDTPEKDTSVKGNMQSMVNSTNSLKPQHGLEATYDHHIHENETLQAKEKNYLRPVAHKAKKKNVITTDAHDTSCPICFEMFNDPHIVPECCHRFCKRCIEEALEYRRECPICRGRVTSRRALRRDEVFGKLMRLLEAERAKANANSVSTIANKNVDEISNDDVAADDHQTKVGEKNEIIDANITSTIADKNVDELSNNDAVAADDNQTKVGEKNETMDDAKSIQKECIQEKEQTQVEQEQMNVNIEGKAQSDAFEGQVQHDIKASEHLETQLEEKSNRIKTPENSMLSACGRTPSAKLCEKNEVIQHLESRLNADEDHNGNIAALASSHLDTQLEEKNSRIKFLEILVRTLSHGDTLQNIAAKFQEKNDRIKYLEEKLQQMTKKLEEGK
ncbi:hypothetical protein CTEN210_00982 [Chaetoceros tenuissimus]|uniref:RING-type E3 ubiquitin transferase n=1 Tax=Chaetoceros tenuissimus TaxID=426638 RepID=A0AAD3GZG1_9STRA|nr:hypothetical protein CTEN210_00982 [Chaetoceros tenuissimus]